MEHLEEALDALNEAAERGPILVEGRRDAAALERLGVDQNVVLLNTGQALLQRCDELGASQSHVTVLMDWDRKGDELARRLHKGLERAGVKVDLEVRAVLRRLTHGSVNTVEELATFYRRVEGAARSKGKPRPATESWRVKKERKAALRAGRQRRVEPRGSKR
jgi:5S rRNA maturation endonuclease (ribonuclease M5)